MPCPTLPQPWMQRTGAAGPGIPSSCPSQDLWLWKGSLMQPSKMVSAFRAPQTPLPSTCWNALSGWRKRDAESALGSALWGRGAAALGVVVRGKPAPSLPPVESLRRLILWGLLPGHPAEAQASGEPEADRTPTPSLMSSASQPRDPGSPGPERDQPEQEDTALCSLEHLPPRARNSGIWESPELDRNPEEETSNTEAAGSYKVVRKGKSIGTSTGETGARFTEVEASLPNGALSGKACAQRLPDPRRRRRHTKASGSGSRGSKPVT